MPQKSTTPTRRNLVAHVVDALRQQIQDGTFKVGDKLPTEARMTSDFSVSRTVIREAIATLRADGIVDPRQGSGVYVLEPAANPLRPFQVIDPEKISAVIEVLELRTAVETEAAALAATRRSPSQEEDIFLAEAEIRRLAALNKPTTDADFTFHQAIASATNNPRFTEFLNVLGPTAIPRLALRNEQAAHTPESNLSLIASEHRAIADAIANADPEAARTRMRQHLAGSQQRYRQLLRDSRN